MTRQKIEIQLHIFEICHELISIISYLIDIGSLPAGLIPIQIFVSLSVIMSPIASDEAATTATCGLQLQAKSPLADRLYAFYEDTIAAVEELVFPIDPELNTSLLSASSQGFLEDLLDQLIRWGVDIYGRSGSLRAIGETFLGNQIERILARMQDEVEVIRLRAQQWQKIR